MAKILVADDDIDQTQSIADVLEKEFHRCEQVHDGAEAIERLKFYHYDLVVLDWQMPRMDGIEVLRRFRASGGNTPVLMLTGLSAASNKIDGLDSGADDYLTKPFHAGELASRVRALLRRPSEARAAVYSVGNMQFDGNRRALSIKGAEVELSPLELQVIEYFLAHANETVSQEALLERVWSSESDASAPAVYTCIKSLRKKIQGDAETPVISTVYSLGYRLEIKKKRTLQDLS